MLVTDGDADGILTEEEFVALPRGQVDIGGEEQDRVWQDERRREFTQVIDLNKDGLVDETELKVRPLSTTFF